MGIWRDKFQLWTMSVQAVCSGRPCVTAEDQVRWWTANSHTCRSLSRAYRGNHEHTHYTHSQTHTRTPKRGRADRESGCSSKSSFGRQLWDAMGLHFKGQGHSSLHSPGSYTVMRPIRRLPQGGIQSLSLSSSLPQTPPRIKATLCPRKLSPFLPKPWGQ